MDKNFRKAVLDYGELFIQNIIKQILLNNKKASGDLIDSLDYRVIEIADTVVLEILANPYLTIVDKGLRPGHFPNVSRIIKWAEVRKLKPHNKKYKTTSDVGWAVAKSIDRKGIKPTHILRKAKASLMANKEALNKVVGAAQLDINDLIKQSIKNLNK
jgi:hypothetical protein